MLNCTLCLWCYFQRVIKTEQNQVIQQVGVFVVTSEILESIHCFVNLRTFRVMELNAFPNLNTTMGI